MLGSFVKRALLLSSVVCLAFSAAACKERQSAEQSAAEPTAAVKPVVRQVKSQTKPELMHRSEPQAPLQQFVQQHVEEADASGKRVLVYVGASWCEPCQRFHKALASGQLDELLAGTQFIEFDADRDRAELREAGYASKFIPLFSVPDQSGHASGRAIEGSIKGDDAVREDLVPRLLALLDGKPAE
jgi:thiol:disulfide interchange protein